MKIISWNVGGMSDRNKITRVLRKVREQKADIIVLQETYKTGDPDKEPEMDRKINRIKNYMELIWRGDTIVTPHITVLSPFNHSLKLVAVHSKSRVVDFTFTHVARGDRKIHVPYFLINIRAVYAPVNNKDKTQFWTSLPPLLPLSWMVGDFNTPLSLMDTHNNKLRNYMVLIRDTLNKLDLVDTHKELKGNNAEHTHIRPNSSYRLDYIFAPPSLLSPHASAHVIPPGTVSEHSLVVLDNKKRTGRPRWRMNVEHAKDQMMKDMIEDSVSHAEATTSNWDTFKASWTDSFKKHGMEQQRKS